MTAPRVYTIDADAPFLDALAEGLLAEGRDDLADQLLLLPSRRACLALRDAFLERSGGEPLLLPRLRPVGDLDAEELLLDPELELDLPPAIPAIRRRLLLTRLVLARRDPRDGREVPHEQAIRLAGELAAFLDELHDEGVPLERLDGLVPDELAHHWQLTAAFLGILREAWPSLLGAEGRIDPAARRARLLEAAARRWPVRPPARLVTAAGIGGSLPAVARLLAAVARLPGGRVVLPGLDRAMPDADWQALGPSHPQWSLRRLLRVMAVERTAVAPWPYAAWRRAARRALWRAVMRPADGGEPLDPAAVPPEALDGLAVVTAPDLASEAVQIALRLRAALETPGRRAALVTADRNLARRVAAELARWRIRVDDSAGVPLDQSPPGSFLLLTAHVVIDGGAPATLLSALKHPLAAGGMEQGAFRRHVRALERALLRGPRPAGGLAGLLALLRGRDPEERWPAPIAPDQLAAWLERLIEAAASLQRLADAGTAPLANLLQAHVAFAEALAADASGEPRELWAEAAGVVAQRVIAEFGSAADALPAVPVTAYPALLAVVMGQHAVRPRAPAHPRLAILGQLESRLVQAELVIVGGLNEGVWPRSADAGPWLNRAMREQLGLPPVEQLVGTAAHDLVALGSAPEVVLSRARKDEAGAPTIVSRWLARLEATLRAVGLSLPDPGPWQAWAQRLDEPRDGGWPVPIDPPAPRPPLAMRPREVWATDVERLMRSPYDFYARTILGLRPLEPIDAQPGGAERGQVLHAILAEFARNCDQGWPADPLGLLREIGRRHFAPLEHRPEVWAFWWPRFLTVAEWIVPVEQARRAEAARILGELQGATTFTTPAGEFLLRARADRIEARADGTAVIVDHKTGRPPKPADVLSGRAPQLPIEGLIVEAGGFSGLGPLHPLALEYFALRGGEPAGEIREAAKVPLEELLERAREGLTRLLAHFADPAIPYVAIPRPAAARYQGDYDHLARVAEWRGAERPRP
jgi:ATP-dependent helicase/nuclease subunit B